MYKVMFVIGLALTTGPIEALLFQCLALLEFLRLFDKIGDELLVHVAHPAMALEQAEHFCPGM